MSSDAATQSMEQTPLTGWRSPKSDGRRCALLIAALTVFYLPLQSGFWVPSSDGSYYLVTARNLAKGDGFTFNGEAVQLIPPGWPAVLATALRVSPSFVFLSGVSLACLLGAAGIWYYILRRFADQYTSSAIVLVSGCLYSWYSSTTNLCSEALFSLLLAGAILVAFQISERRRLAWRLPVLLTLCAAAVTVRWAGILMCPVVAAAAIHRSRWPRLDRQWITAALCIAATFGAYAGWRARPLHISSASVHSSEVSARIFVKPAGTFAYSPVRALEAGEWTSGLVWAPARLAMTSKPVAWLANLAGWILLLLYGISLCREMRTGGWIWLATLLCILLLAARWRLPVPRYLMPVAPLLLLGFRLGYCNLTDRLSEGRIQTWIARLATGAVAATVMCNLVIYGVDVWIARSSDFAQRYYAGYAADLAPIAAYLGGRDVRDGEFAVSPCYLNLAHYRNNTYAPRLLSVLMDVHVETVPTEVWPGEPDAQLAAWAQEHGVRYLLYRPPVSPWRLWHFRAGWLQKWVTGETVVPNNPSWELFELTDDKLAKVVVECGYDWPRRVPFTEAPQTMRGSDVSRSNKAMLR
jgi:hypothetical protein